MRPHAAARKGMIGSLSEPPPSRLQALLPGRRGLWVVLAITAAAYGQALWFGWAYDDFAQIVNNETLVRPGAVGRAFTQHVWAFAPESAEARYYRPLFTLFLIVLRRVVGLQPWAWHGAVIALHLGAVAVLWHLVRALSGSAVAATVGTLLFAIHPAKAESVGWVSGLTDPMAALVGLGAVLAWVHDRRVFATALFALALLSKETAVVFAVFPAALAVGERRWRDGAVAAGLWGAVAVGYLLVRGAVVGEGAQTLSESGGAMTVVALIATYTDHFVAPVVSSLTYPLSDSPALALLGIGGFVVASVLAGPARPLVWMGGLFLLPVLNPALLQPDMLVQDRYLYLPSACWLGAAGWGLSALDRRRPGRLVPVAVGPLAATWLVMLSMNLRSWQDNRTVWEWAVVVNPGHGRAWLNLGVDHENAGELARAEACYRQALEFEPGRAIVHFRLAFLLAERQELGEAVVHFARAADMRPEDPMLLYEAARLEAFLGERETAAARLTAARAASDAGAVPGGGVTREDIEGLLSQLRGSDP